MMSGFEQAPALDEAGQADARSPDLNILPDAYVTEANIWKGPVG